MEAPGQPSRFGIGNASKIAVAVLLASLSGHFALFMYFGVSAIAFPYELDYGEGIVWQQMRSILSGQGYTPLGVFPAIVFHYPPIYHLTAAAVASMTSLDMLASGRLVSFVSALTCGLLVALWTARLTSSEQPWVRWSSASTAGLSALAFLPVHAWAPLMRVDMLACALSLAGLQASILALRRPGWIHLASALFVAALYTKQIMVSAPAAVFIVLLLVRPKLAWQGIATAVVLGAVALLVLAVLTDGGFIRHVFFYNVNRFEVARLWFLAAAFSAHAVWVGLGYWAAARSLPDLRLRGWRDLEHSTRQIQLLIGALYLLLTTVALVAVGKVGASINYFVEWAFALAPFIGLSLSLAFRSAFGGVSHRPLMAVVIPLALAVQPWLIDGPRRHESVAGDDLNGLRVIEDRIRSARGPVISDDMVLLLRSGREVLWEPAIAAELASTGVYDERAFVRMIQERRFAFFITMGDERWARFRERYNPIVRDALQEHYPIREYVGERVVHLPAEKR